MRSAGHYALGALLVWGSLLPLSFALPQAYANQARTGMDADLLYSHVERLAKTARPAATETEFAAGVYVENALRSYGYETALQPFYYHTYQKPASLSLAIEGWERSWAALPLTFGQNGAQTAELVDAGYGRAADFASGAARGKIALVKRGEIPFGEKVRQAAAAGAVAVIVWNDREGEWRASLGEPLDMSVPVIGLSREEGQLLRQRALKQPLRATVKVEGGVTRRHTAYNIIATKKPTEAATGQRVLILAHHDSAASSPGANDNASGVAVMLEVARKLSESQLDTEVQLVSFGAVTAGQRGQRAFSESLTEQDRQKIVAAYYVDAVGRSGDVTAFAGRREAVLATGLLAEAGAQQSALEVARAEQQRELAPLTVAGIPAVLVTRQKAAGEADRAGDVPATIEKEQLAEAAQMIFSAVGNITDTATPAYPIPSGQTTGQGEPEEDFQ
ncbi:aminopeptidase [Brevibacillus agri]|uniref:M28 family peptidase n=1 Tax=Brevibacillus agri TaxID=51101 RepID=UPI0018CD8598|nr:M28 family peptidase [Brevibacillus agri]MBG9568849.1 aminopeptidase [Brevibacillus agri]MDR9503210.1 M28 family peptidase [Brevibacillus agri]